MIEEKRIYVVVAGTVQVPVSTIRHEGKVLPDLRKGLRTVVQPSGRQFAQGIHVGSKLRFELGIPGNDRITTITLSARDSAELGHIYFLLHKKHIGKTMWSDDNIDVYGPGEWPTAIAAYATKKQTIGILDYLPKWGE